MTIMPPGFDSDGKMQMFQHVKDLIDVVICTHAGDIERKKMRGDFGNTMIQMP